MAERIVGLASAIHSAESELVALLAEFHEAEGWMGAGIRSSEHWLTLNAGFTATAPQAAAVFQHYAMVEESERRRRRRPVDADTPDSGGEESPDDERGPLTWWRHWWDDQGHPVVDTRLDPTGGAELVAALDADLVRAWPAEARVDLLLHDRGRPLWMSRAQPVASAAQRRAPQHRGHGCAFPGCGHPRFVDAHHIRSWEHGGGTDLDTLVLLCLRHHRLLHAGEYSIAMVDGRPQFLHRDLHHDGSAGTPIGPRRRRHLPAPLPRPPDPGRARRSGEPLTRFGIDVHLADLLGP